MNRIQPNTIYIGKYNVFYESVDSTNSEMKRLLDQKKISHGTLVYTDFQSMGKGQMLKTWDSKAGLNILASLYLSFKNKGKGQFTWLSFLIALALHEALSSCIAEADDLKIKWPNDIFIGNQKVAGILIENSFLGNEVRSIIGFGINVNQEVFDDPRATSILLLNGEEMDRKVVLNKVLISIEKLLKIVDLPAGLKQLHQLYVGKLYKKDEYIHLEENNQKVKVLGVDGLGRLVLDKDNTQLVVANNEKKLIWNS